MPDKLSLLAATSCAVLALGGIAEATCDVDKAGYDLTGDEAEAIYECLEAEMFEGYKAGDKRWIPTEYVTDYRSWVRASSFPAAPGFHSGRFLNTWVNDVGAEAYMKYEEDPEIPAGTLIAKESFSVDDNGKVTRGPLFFMEKTETGVSPETDDWYYMMVSAGGAPQGIDVVTACSECHQGNFAHQGGLGYPVEDARVR